MDFFNKFTLETPESVELDFTLAGIGNRAFALVIDYFYFLLILIIYLLGSIVFSQVITTLIEAFLPNLDKIEMWLTAIFGVTFFFIYVGYFVIFETLWQGQTPGKRRVKIRVIRDDGRPVGLQQATLRALLRPVDDILFIGALLIIFSKQEKRLGDWVAGTLVIQEEKPNNSATFIISEEAKQLVTYLTNHSHLSRLSPENFAVIRAYLQQREGMLTQAKHELSRKLAYQVKDIIELEDIPENTTANHFLEAVYLAYQQGIENRE